MAETNIGGSVTLSAPYPITQTLNHNLYYVNNGEAVLFGTILSVNGSTVTTDNTTESDEFLDGKFVFAKENSYINGRNMRGNILNVKILDNTSEELELYAIKFNTTKANNV
jgi:hypothetical protein